MIEKKDVRKVARLARIQIEEKKLKSLSDELSNIIKFVDQLDEVEIQNVEPLQNINFKKTTMRKDIITEGNDVKKIMSNAPLSSEGFFSVPKVIE